MDTSRIKTVLRSRYFRYGLIFIFGLLLGWMIFGGGSSTHSEAEHTRGEAESQVWTCSMHPQIKMDKPGKCPLCAMDLIPLKSYGAGASDEMIDPDAIQLSREAMALANIQTTTVSRQNPIKELQLYGTIQADERLLQSQSSHVGGRIEKMLINFTGESVRQGQAIATIYSPDLLSAQQELLEAVKMSSQQPLLLQASREKLRRWRLSDDQIAKIEQTGELSTVVEIRANTSGVVVNKRVSQGDYIEQGTVLLDIANLSQVWAMFDAYEADLPFLRVGDRVEFTIQAIPSKVFSGRISFIDPILDKTTRTVKVRVEAANQGMQLKPEMYANASIKASLKEYANEFVIPRSAVLWTGKRSIIYVKQPNVESAAFMLREIELGPSLGDAYVVISGIEDGEQIVTNGVFSVDASAQLEGRRSMMNMEPTHKVTGEQHHATLKVEGLCGMCKDRIESSAKGVTGVSSAEWDQETKELHLKFDATRTSVDAISKAVAKAGHDTDKHKTEQKTYDALPGCCQYRVAK